MLTTLEFTSVSYTFKTSSNAYTVLNEINFAINNGEFIAIVGPTGCGKSTLLNLAAGLVKPTTGTIKVLDNPLYEINHQAGYLLQADSLLPWRNVLDNVTIGLKFRAVPAQDAIQQAQQWLERVGLFNAAKLYPHQLSGGMKKRVALAQMLIVDPTILLMDEPFSALDIHTRQLMENELLTLWSSNQKAVLFVTHDLEEAIALSDRVILLSAGPEARLIGSFVIPLPRPRDVTEIRFSPQFIELFNTLWHAIKAEVIKAYAA